MKGYYLYKSALLALLVMIHVNITSSCKEHERIGLLGLRQLLESNGADSSKHLPDWTEYSQRDCCEWERVVCDNATGHVTELFLWNLKDIESINEEDGLINDIWTINCSLFLPFSELKSLNLAFNSFAQWETDHGFEKLSALEKLEILDLNENNFDNNTIYHSLGAITSLKTLLLRENGLGGSSFPTNELAGLVNLEILDLSYSDYEDWLPKEGFEKLSVFKKLETLNLGYSDLTVEILPYLNSLTSLKVLNLQGNGFTGLFPAQELGDLANLEGLDLSHNSLTEIQGFEKLSVFKKLETLNLGYNDLTVEILPYLNSLTSLKVLNLQGNGFTGLFPAQELGDLANLEGLDLSRNSLTEIQGLESLGKFKKLTSLDVSFNMFNRSLFQSLSPLTSLKNLSFAVNMGGDPFPARELTVFLNLEMLDLSNNNLNSLTEKDCELLSKLNKMRHLDLANNRFGKDVFRILGAFPSLRFLSLTNNDNMEGPLSNLNLTYNHSSLEVLLLNGNYLNGSLPVEGLASLRFLEVLDLKGNSFFGSIPQSIGKLSSLKVLSLASNKLNGSLPDQGLCELANLVELDLSKNLLEGPLPPCLRNLKSLRLFNIALNSFTGNLSSSLLGSLSSLEYIDLSHNLFVGTFLFSSLANHTNLVVFEIISDNGKLEVETEDTDWFPMFQLRVLVLSNCNLNTLSGNKIPKFLLHQNKLRAVVLSENNLNDLLPNWLLVNNTGLDVLNVRKNSLFGPFYLPSVHNTDTLDFSDNHLNGKIQANVGNMLHFVSVLNLSNNAFEGNIPSSIVEMRTLSTLDLSSNNFSGEVPRLLLRNQTFLNSLILSNNSLHGQFFSSGFNLTWLWRLQLGDNQFTGPLATSIFTSELFYLDVSNNHFSGDLSNSIDIITTLGTVILRNNSFVGEFPCSLVAREFMDVSYNSLSGPISSCSNPNLPFLKHLHLQGNKFTGLIPQAFLNSSYLLTLDISENLFSGTIPMVLTPLPELRILLSRGNLLNGSIPSHICQFNKISLMDLSNNFFTGTIPRCFSNITFGLNEGYDLTTFVEYPMGTHYDAVLYNYEGILSYEVDSHGEYVVTYSKSEEVNFVTKSRAFSYQGNILNYMSGLDLSSNKLTGEIPTELGELSAIHALNLSHNHLIGPIPKSLSNLKQVESLDLSYNELRGNIPMELTNLNYLEVFSVAYNNLSGTIPYGKAQFGTFNATSYEGNAGLCGPPLEKSCNPIVDNEDKPSEETNGEWFGDDRVIISAIFGAAYITFLVGTLTVVCINPKWRKWWFDVIDAGLYYGYFFFVNLRRKLGR